MDRLPRKPGEAGRALTALFADTDFRTHGIPALRAKLRSIEQRLAKGDKLPVETMRELQMEHRVLRRLAGTVEEAVAFCTPPEEKE